MVAVITVLTYDIFLITNFNIEDQIMSMKLCSKAHIYIASIKSTKKCNKNYDIVMNRMIRLNRIGLVFFFWQRMLNSSQLINLSYEEHYTM